MIYLITEGATTRIKTINFLGARAFSHQELESALLSKENKWYLYFSNGPKWDPDRVNFDAENIRRYYSDRGYHDTTVGHVVTEISQDRRDFVVTFVIEEGARYKLGGTSIESPLTDLPAELLWKTLPKLGLETGDWANLSQITAYADSIGSAANDLGFPFVRVTADTTYTQDQSDSASEQNTEQPTGVVDVVYRIERTDPVYIESVIISGNTVTHDRIIRRALLFHELDPYNQSRVNQSINRLRQLGYFEGVSIQPHPGSSAGKVVLEINVKEARTASVNFSFGVSTFAGATISGTFTESNFRGTGQNVRFNLAAALESRSLSLSFEEPSWNDSPISYNYQLGYTLSDYSTLTYSLSNLTVGTGIGFRVNDHWRYRTNFRYSEARVFEIHDDASEQVLERAGTRNTISMQHQLSFADLVGLNFPRRGYAWNNALTYAGFGGDAAYVRSNQQFQTTYYFSNSMSWGNNLTATATAPAGKHLTVTERSSLGGTSFRGFSYGGIGPRDSATGAALGGKYAAVLASTLIFPVGVPDNIGVRAIVFADAGTLTGVRAYSDPVNDNGSIRIGAGWGIAWRTPFGPLQFLFPQAIQKERHDIEQTFLFSVGG